MKTTPHLLLTHQNEEQTADEWVTQDFCTNLNDDTDSEIQSARNDYGRNSSLYNSHVDPGSIQGNHRPMSVMMNKYKTRANSLTITVKIRINYLPRT